MDRTLGAVPPAQSDQPTHSIQPAHSVEPARSDQPARSVHPANTTQQARSIGSAGPIRPTSSTRDADLSHCAGSLDLRLNLKDRSRSEPRREQPPNERRRTPGRRGHSHPDIRPVARDGDRTARNCTLSDGLGFIW
ncbi:hypothetical protein GCM10010522_43090 [Kribbella solani]